MKKILILLCILLLTFSTSVGAQVAPTTFEALVNVAHEDGNAGSLSSTSATGLINHGTAGYMRQLINVFDLDTLKIPEGYVLDKATWSIYCLTNYVLSPSVVGVYELEEGFDYATTQLTMDNIPARDGSPLATFDMPARVNGATYNAYMDFDLTDYFKQAIASGKRYAALSAFHTARVQNGGMLISTKYGDYPPTLTITWRRPQLVAEGHHALRGTTEVNALSADTLTYSVDLYNETNEQKSVRLILAEVCDNYCVSVSIGEVTAVEAGERKGISLSKAATSTANKMRFFVVEDTGTLLKPIINEKYELAAGGWQ